MSAAAKILKNFNLFVDGRSYAGQIDEVQLPDLAIKTEDFRAGGMDSSVALDMGMEKLEATFKTSGWEPEILKLWGLGPGASKILVFRGALESLNGAVEPVVVTMEGTVDDVKADAVTPGAKASLSVKVSLRAYKYVQADVTIYDIDIVNFKRVVNGVDRLAQIRASIGL